MKKYNYISHLQKTIELEIKSKVLKVNVTGVRVLSRKCHAK